MTKEENKISKTEMENKKKQEQIEKEKKKIEQLEKSAQPLWITEKYVQKPCLVISVCSIIFLICTILTIAFNLFSQSDNVDRAWHVWSDEKVQERDLWYEAEKEFKKKSENNNVPERSEKIDKWSTMIILECYEDCDNVLTQKNFEILRKAEEKIKSLNNYKNFCLANEDGTGCSEEALDSVTNLFTQEEKQDGISFSELEGVLDEILTDQGKYDDYSYLFGKEFKSTNKKTKLLRSIFNFGGPLKIDGKLYKNRYDHEDDQIKEFEDFTQELMDLLKEINEDGDQKVFLLLFSEVSVNLYMNETFNKDFLWALASIVFVWIYLTIHLKSFFLSCFSMLNILMSFPITITIVRLIFQVSYFSGLHILVIFIVLGIAADDVFVFQDAWEQTSQYSQLAGDLSKRMAVTFRRASKAMLATSSTTSAAFLATGFSSIMPISSFGIFAGILIPVNYILVITFYPAILIVHKRYFEKCCCHKKKTMNKKEENNNENDKQQQYQQQQIEIQSNEQQSSQIQNTGKRLSSEKVIPVGINQENLYLEKSEMQVASNYIKDNQQYDQKEMSKIEKFFKNQFNTFVDKGKFVILLVFAVWLSIAIWRSTQMGPQTKPDQWLPDDFELQRAINYLSSDFIQSGESLNVIQVTLLLGLEKIDISETTAWDADNAGKAVFDKNFNLSPENNQQYLYDFCQNLKANSLVLDEVVECFMVEFRDYVVQNGGQFPVLQSEFFGKLKEFSEDQQGQGYYLANQIGIFNNKLNYVAIEVSSVGNPISSYQDQEPIEEDWQKLVENFNKNAPTGINKMRQSSDVWAWMVSQKAYVVQGFQGMLVSLAFAFLVLILSTHNIIVSLFSILSISGIVVSVVSIMELSGWEMGIAESITIVILIGFSVDYVVHLANHYVESTYNDRYTRMQEALQEIGISIISGAITTFGSGVFLLFAVVAIFTKFAVLIVSTISFSLIFSLFFFSSLMHALGPQNDQGNLKEMIKKCSKKQVQNSDINNNNVEKDIEKQNNNNNNNV